MEHEHQPETVSPACENRNHDRRPPRRILQIVCCRGPLNVEANLALSLVDLSARGAGLLLGESVRVGEELSVRLDAPGVSRPPERVATVAWVIPAAEGLICAGLRFDRPLEDAEFARLARP